MKPRSALIIEDHEQSSAVLEKLLHHRKFTTEIRATMEKGLELFNECKNQGRPFSVVVSDLALPDSKVDESLAILAAIRTHCPVVAISGAVDPHIVTEAKDKGVKLLLKGTSGQGIMEAILYELLDKEDSIETAAEIVDNREHAREIPLVHVSTWFSRVFAAMPRWVQATTVITTIFGIGGSVATGTNLVYNKVWTKGASATQVAAELATIQAQIKGFKESNDTHDKRMGQFERDESIVETKLDGLSNKVDENKKDTNERLETIFQAIIAKH